MFLCNDVIFITFINTSILLPCKSWQWQLYPFSFSSGVLELPCEYHRPTAVEFLSWDSATLRVVTPNLP